MTIQLVYKENRADPSILKILWSEGENLLRHTPIPFGTAKVVFPNITHETINHLPYGSQNIRQAIRQTNRVVITTAKDGRKEYEPKEFYEEYSELIKKFRMGTHPAQFVDQALNNAVKNEVVRLLKTQTVQTNTADCWYPGNFDFGITHANQYSPSPIRKIRVFTADGSMPYVENANHNPFHPLYHLMNEDVCDNKEVAEFFERFSMLIMPKERLQYFETILDYFFASLFKNEMRSGVFGEINFPILLIAGEARTGKTWMAQTLMRIIYGYGNDKYFFYNKTVLQGANPMTRMRLECNNVFPIILEEIDNLGSIQEIINPYLTEGILQDTIGTIGGKEKITRTAYYTPMILTNSIGIFQAGGSTAINDRFAHLKVKILPVTDTPEMCEMMECFGRKYPYHSVLLQQIGATIMKTIIANKTAIIESIQRELKSNEISKMGLDSRDRAKLKFFLVGKYLREKVFDMLGVSFVSANTPETYKALITADIESDHVISNKDDFEKMFNEIWTRPIKDYAEHNIYLGDMYSGVGEGIMKGIRNKEISNDFTEEQQRFLKHCYYLEQEHNLLHSTTLGEIIITPAFLRKLSSRTFKLNKDNFTKMFKKYCREVSSCDYVKVDSYFGADSKKMIFEHEIEQKGGQVIKFDLAKYRDDMKGQ